MNYFSCFESAFLMLVLTSFFVAVFFVAFFLLERKGVNDDNGRLRFLCWFREQKTRFSLFEMCSKIAHRLTRGNSSYETEG